MKEILITTLLLGCIFTITSAALFEFFDSYGRCWRCLPGEACVRCQSVPFQVGPCLVPDCTGVPEGETFPHEDARFYWMCVGGQPIEVNCFCEKVYQQGVGCVFSDEVTSISCNPSICGAYTWVCGEPAPLPGDCLNGITTPVPTPVPTPGPPPDIGVCLQPSCVGLPDGTTFPHEDIRFHWTCQGGQAVAQHCDCDRVYQHNVGCVYSDELTQISCNPSICGAYIWPCDNSPPPTPGDCLEATPPTPAPPPGFPPIPTVPNEPPIGTPPPGFPPIPTVPNEPPIGTPPPGFPPIPTVPNEPPIGTPPPGFPPVPTVPNEPPTGTPPPVTPPPVTPPPVTPPPVTPPPVTPPPVTPPPITTEIGGPGTAHPPITDPKTTPAPCVCVVWWPCWCNPCWNMPCHSCHGCVGMTG